MIDKKLFEQMIDKPLFVTMAPSTLEKILERAKMINFKEGQIILKEGEPGDCFYVIEHGSVCIQIEKKGIPPEENITTLYGDETLNHQYEGDFFGEMALLDFSPRSATVITNEDTSLLKINGSMLFEIFKDNHKDHIIFLTNMARILSRRLRRTLKKLRN